MRIPFSRSHIQRFSSRLPARGWWRLVFISLLGLLLISGATDAATRPGVTVVEAAPQGLTLELFVPEVQLQPSPVQEGAVRVVAPALADGRSGEPGQPRLPATSVLVAVPPGAEIRLRLLALDGGRRLPPQNWEIQPFEQPRFADADVNVALVSDLSRSAIGTERVYRPVDERSLAAAVADYQPVAIAEEGYLRDQRFVRLVLRPFELRSDGSLVLHERLRVSLDFVNAAPPTAPAPADPYFEQVYRQAFINYEQGRGWRQAPNATVASRAGNDAPPGRLRIITNADGIYTLSYDDLLNAGLKLSKIDARTFTLTSRGQEIALWVKGESDGRMDPGDTITFYGQRSQSRYSDERVYWLSWGQTPGKRMTAIDASPSPADTLVNTSTATLHQEQNNVYLSNAPPAGEADRWYWDRYAVGGRNNIPTLSKQFPVSAVVPGQQAELTVAVRGFTDFFTTNPDHRLEFSINNQFVGSGEWDGSALLVQSYPFSSDLLNGANDSFTLFAPGDTGASTDVGYLDWFEIRYERRLQAVDDQLFFGDDLQGPHRYEVDGFSQGGLELFDISDVTAPVRLLNAAEVSAAGVRVQFSVNGDGDNRFLVQHPQKRLSPLRIEPDYVTNYRTPYNQADYIIITHADFIDAIQPLAQYRYDQGYNVMVVDVQDVYDEFNNGELSPWAIRDFLDYAYHNWQSPRPAYVLLVGDATYDFLDYEGLGVQNYIPPLLDIVDPFLSETATDNRMVTVSGNDNLPDMFIGRFPARTPAQVTTMVNKTIQYETAPWPGDWLMRNLFVADNADTAGDFAYLSNKVADYLLPGAYDSYKQKIYLGVNYSSTTAARQALRQAWDQGAFLTNYVGHGQVTFWASEFIYRSEDAAAAANGGRLPVHLSMTCLDGRFQEPDRESLAETLILNPSGGAVAVWAATGLGVAHGHDYMHQGFYSALYQEGRTQLGDLIVAGKLALYTGDTLGVFHDLIDTFNLLGDPALRLGLAPTDVALELVEAPTKTLTQGDPVLLRLRVSNRADMPAPATYVDVDMPLLDNLSASSDLGPVQIISGASLRFVLGELEAGTSTVLEIRGNVPRQWPQNPYMLSAHVGSAWAEQNPADNDIGGIELRVLAADMTVELAMSPNRALAPGEPFQLTIQYQNRGPGLASSGVISLALPGDITGLSWIASDAAVTQTAASPLTLSVPDLPQNTGGTITIQATAGSSLLRVPLRAYGSIPWPDADLSNNVSASVWFAVAAADADEPNDDLAAATPLTVPGRLADRSYDRAGDADWYVFTAKAGVRYRFYTDRLTSAGDTLLILYDAGGQEIMRSDDVAPGFKWSSLSWQPQVGGAAYLQVTRPGLAATPFLYDLVAERGFDLYIPILWAKWRPPASPPTPLPTPKRTPTPSPTPKQTPTPTLTPTPKRPPFTPTPTPTPTLPPASGVGQCLPTPFTTIYLKGSPLALAAAEKRVLAGMSDANAVAVIDNQSVELIGAHDSGGDQPRGMTIWNSRYYVSNRGSNSVSIFDLASNQRLTTFATGAQPGALSISGEGYLYVGSEGDNGLTVHRADDGTLIRSTRLPGRPNQLLAVGSTTWVTLDTGSYGLLAVDAGGAVLSPIADVPSGALGMAYESHTGRVYVSHPAQQAIYVIDSDRRKVVDKFVLPFAPYGLEINTANGQLYAVAAEMNELAVLDMRNGDILGQLSVGRQGADGGLGIVYLDGHVYVAGDVDRALTVFTASSCVRQ